MARKRLEPYKKCGPKTAEARSLAQNVFILQKRLGISNDAMAAETGLKKTQLSALKSAWVNKKRNYGFMKITIANIFVRFWNSHLRAKTPKVAEHRVMRPKETHANADFHIVEVLVDKVGLEQAKKLLAERGKSGALADYLEQLSPEKLADLV